jgi:CheY-like chemotaxis protein
VDAEISPEIRKIAAPAPRRARILIVDDDAVLAKALGRILRDHDVTVLGDAREARDRIGRGERFDLILCDLVMPEMTGMELYAEIAREAPEQLDRMVFVSGGAFTPATIEFLGRVPNERIDKPFDHGNVRALVQRRAR